MANKREVKIWITADASGVDKAAGQVESRLGGLSGKMKGALAGISIAAIGAGVMSVARDFQEAALAANDFATASGLSVDQASRWQEVAGDLGVDASKLQAALGKLSKGLGGDRKKWEQYGVAVASASDGTVDANKTFLNAVNALHKIEDPLERAKLGSELFGRSWQDLAPLVELSAEELTAALEGVGEAQVIDEAEVEKAKKFRDRMDELNDSTMGMKLTLAEALLPALSGLSGWISTLDPQMLTWIVTLGGVLLVVGKIGTAVSGVSSMLTIFAAHPVFTATLLVVAGLALIVKNWDSISAAIDRAIAKVDEFSAKISGPFASIYKTINNAAGGNFGKGELQLGPAGQAYLNGKAAGGDTMPGAWHLVGEDGPELFRSDRGGTVIPNRQLGSGSVTQIFNVYPSAGMDETALARKVQRQRDDANRGLGLVPA